MRKVMGQPIKEAPPLAVVVVETTHERERERYGEGRGQESNEVDGGRTAWYKRYGRVLRTSGKKSPRPSRERKIVSDYTGRCFDFSETLDENSKFVRPTYLLKGIFRRRAGGESEQKSRTL